MFKKISLCLSVLGSMMAVVACNNMRSSGIMRAEVWQPQIAMPGSVVVCRSKQCAPTKLATSKEYIYNSLMHLLDNNTQSKALLCAADAASHVCTENYITIPITVGVTPANMYIDDVKITDVSVALGRNALNLVLNYNVTYNGQTPTCKPAQSLVYVKNTNNIILEDAGYTCKMTTIGNTSIKTLFAIDYIDLDYGYIGGYYSIGLSGPAYGGDSGYMLMRLAHDAYPLAPVLTIQEEPKPVVVPTPAPAPEQVAAPQKQEEKAKETTKKEDDKKASEKEEKAEKTKTKATGKTTESEVEDKNQDKAEAKARHVKKKRKKSDSSSVVKVEPYSGVQVFPIMPRKQSVQNTKVEEVKTEDTSATERKPFKKEAPQPVEAPKPAEQEKK